MKNRLLNVLLISLSFFVNALICSVHAENSITSADLLNSISDTDFVKAEFLQTKYLKAADTTLESSGFMMILKDKGIIIEQSEPFENTTVVTDRKIQEIMDDEEHVITRDDNPQVFEFTKSLMQIFSKDLSSTRDFKINIKKADKDFVIELIPLDEMMSKIFKSIEICAEKFINRITLVSISEDVTTICLSNHSTDKSVLTDREKKLLE